MNKKKMVSLKQVGPNGYKIARLGNCLSVTIPCWSSYEECYQDKCFRIGDTLTAPQAEYLCEDKDYNVNVT